MKERIKKGEGKGKEGKIWRERVISLLPLQYKNVVWEKTGQEEKGREKEGRIEKGRGRYGGEGV